MASKKGISYQSRTFLIVLLSFWTIIISMALWQVYRVREIKRELVYDQLTLIGERIAAYSAEGQNKYVASFMDFINDFYREAHNYDDISILVLNSNETPKMSVGPVIADNFVVPVDKELPTGIMKLEGSNLDNSDVDIEYMYYITRNVADEFVCVLLPYTNAISNGLAATTTRFWMIFFAAGLFVTILAYISSSFFSRNIRILRNFARKASEDTDFVNIDTEQFPHDELGEISRRIVTIYNQRVIEMENREREHKVALHAMEEKERIKRELTSNINHELKTPVGVIQGYIDTIVENPDMDEATREKFLLKTQQNVHRLTSLIADITAITRLEKNGKLVNVEPINFHDMVFTFENYVKECGVLENKMKFIWDIPLKCEVLGNDSLLQAVIMNLVKNAAKYSGGTECKLETVKEDKDFWYFKFYDNGIGVPPEHITHIFERFYRVNSGRSRDTGGTGLGLAIVEVTINSFGGEISAQNRYPSGLEFNFSLPKYKRKHSKTQV